MRQEKYPPLPALSVSLLSRTASLYFYSNRISPRFQPLQTKKTDFSLFFISVRIPSRQYVSIYGRPGRKAAAVRSPRGFKLSHSSSVRSPRGFELSHSSSAPAFISGLIALQVFEKRHRDPSRRAVRSHAYCLIFSSPSTKKVIFSTQCMQYIKTPSKRLLFPEKGFIIPSPGRLDIYSTFTIAFKKVFR